MNQLWTGLAWFLAIAVGVPLVAFLIGKFGTLGYLRALECFERTRKNKETTNGST